MLQILLEKLNVPATMLSELLQSAAILAGIERDFGEIQEDQREKEEEMLMALLAPQEQS